MPRVELKNASSQGIAPGSVSLERKFSSGLLRRNTSVSGPLAETPRELSGNCPANTSALFSRAENSTA